MTTVTRNVAAYVDGFNLFYGLRSKGWKRYYWLDLDKLITKLLYPGEQLVAIRYFTARVMPDLRDPGKHTRQGTYLDALETIPILTTKYGRFLSKLKTCRHCGKPTTVPEEKMTDVNIAVALLTDAQDGIFDRALVVSGDSDLSGPIQEVRRRYPSKQVVVAFPPDRVSNQLRAEGPSFVISRDKFRDSQFPITITNVSGHILTKPSMWT